MMRLGFVEAIKDRAGQLDHHGVWTHHRQAAQHDIQARRFRRVVPAVFQIGLVHDRSDPPQHRVHQVVAAQQRLEGAVITVVAELHAPHVERDHLIVNIFPSLNELQLSVWVDELSDQPR